MIIVQFRDDEEVESWTTQMRDHPHRIKGWTTSFDDAIHESTPNRGQTGRLSYMQRRLKRNGFEEEAVTNIGAIAITHTKAVNVGCITRGNTADTWWLHDPIADSRIHIAWKK